jgi:threonylcarbamoyladenosine tRNA methylthiotransferase MtaB
MQAGDDMILKRMKRRHLRHHLYEITARARSLRPGIVFGADIIAGFPTEDEKMFENTAGVVRDCDLTFLHVFPYSPRPGTPAAKMPQVDGAVRKERARILRELGACQLNRHLASLVGRTMPVLAEKDRKGHTEYFSAVRLDRDIPQGQIVNVKMEAVEGDSLRGLVLA